MRFTYVYLLKCKVTNKRENNDNKIEAEKSVQQYDIGIANAKLETKVPIEKLIITNGITEIETTIANENKYVDVTILDYKLIRKKRVA